MKELERENRGAKPGNLSRGPRVMGDGIRELVNTLLICRGVHKKFMAGNQEPMLRHIKRSTGGRLQSGAARILKRGGPFPVYASRISRKIANLGFIYLYRSTPYFADLPPPVG